jgi:hypothetical protein
MIRDLTIKHELLRISHEQLVNEYKRKAETEALQNKLRNPSKIRKMGNIIGWCLTALPAYQSLASIINFLLVTKLPVEFVDMKRIVLSTTVLKLPSTLRSKIPANSRLSKLSNL